jgi:hypothetical protein
VQEVGRVTVRKTIRKQVKKPKPPGIAVCNRFRVDAYFKTREQIETIDRCASLYDESRSQYVTRATLQRVERDCGEKL